MSICISDNRQLLKYRPAEGVEGGDELLFTSLAIAVAYGVETRGVGHLGQVGEFVPHDVIAQVLRQEGDDIAEVNLAA